MRAHLFQGNNYYPSHMDDYVKSFDSHEDAEQYALDNPKSDWYSIVVDDGTELKEYFFGYYPRNY